MRKILNKPDGMKVLEAVLADGAKKEEKTMVAGNIPVVAVLVPSYKAPNPRMQSKLLEMRQATEKSGLAHTLGMPLIRNSVVHWQRNDLIAELIKSGRYYTHILFIDDDIVPEPDSLLKLLAHKVDIVAGLCTFRCDPPLPNARYYDDKSFRFYEMRDWSADGLVEVDAVGTGMMLISREALQKVADVWFEAKLERDRYGVSDEWVAAASEARTKAFDNYPNAFWFQFAPTPDYGVREFGEDISFCHKAQKFAGLKVWVDTSINPEHIGEYGYTVADYKSARKHAKNLAAAEGRMVVTPSLVELEANTEPLKISILCPTRGRPENVKRLMESIASMSAEMPEIVLYVDEDDETMEPWAFTGHDNPWLEKLGDKLKVCYGSRRLLSECWNVCAKVATGDILMHAGDDIIFQTKHWDVMVQNAFRSVPDKIIFVHGDDGHFGKQFGTHGLIHRKWMEATGYFVPPYFSSDFNDTWLNDVANALGRRVYLPFKTEHMHPLFGKAEWDTTHKERLARHQADKVDELYASKAPERAADVEKLKAVIAAHKTVITQELVNA